MRDLPSDRIPPAPLAAAGLRPTRQRRALVALLFDGRDRHFTAEMLHEEAKRTSASISLATIYNTLHRLTTCGYLTKVVVSSGGVYFDTNIGDHHHFIYEDTGELEDIPFEQVCVSRLPLPPEGTIVSRVEVTIRLKPK